MKLQINIEFNIDHQDWDKILDQHKDEFYLLVTKVIGLHDNYKNLSQIELSVFLTDNKEIQNLNKEFRNKDRPTNILSFPEKEILPSRVLENKIEGDYMYLGDMALCYDIIVSEAKERGIPLRSHLLHLFLHGLLHLIGYNHTQDQEAEDMESTEVSILSQFGIKSPY